VLRDAGYRPPDGFVIDDLDAWVARRAATPRMRALALHAADADGFEIDVHWQLGRNPPPTMSAAAMLDRAERAPVAGGTLQVAAPVDAMLLTSQHALRSWLLPRSTVKDLCDLAAWAETGADRWAVQDLVDAAASSGIGSTVLALLQVLDVDGAAPRIAAARRALAAELAPPSRRTAARLAGLFDDQLRAGLNPDLLLALAAPATVGRGLAARVLRRVGRGATPPPSRAEWLFPDRPAGHPATAAGRAAQAVRDGSRSLPSYVAVVRAHAAYR
jgi:hypothetical protein